MQEQMTNILEENLKKSEEIKESHEAEVKKNEEL